MLSSLLIVRFQERLICRIPMRKCDYFFVLIICLISNVWLNCAPIMEMRNRRSEALEEPDYSPYAGIKRRLAIVDFQDSTTVGEGNAGSALCDMIVSCLHPSGCFMLVKCSDFEKILDEQGMSQVGSITEQSAIRAGQLFGAHALLFGKVEELSYEITRKDVDSKKEKWGFTLTASTGKIVSTYRLLDSMTGEIIASGTIYEREIKPGLRGHGKDFDFANINELDETVVGIAMRRAANRIAMNIYEHTADITWWGKVVKVAGDSLFFTPGRADGVHIGQFIQIYQEGEQEKGEKFEMQVIGHLGERISIANNASFKTINVGDLIVEKR